MHTDFYRRYLLFLLISWSATLSSSQLASFQGTGNRLHSPSIKLKKKKVRKNYSLVQDPHVVHDHPTDLIPTNPPKWRSRKCWGDRERTEEKKEGEMSYI